MGKNALMTALFVIGVLSGECMKQIEEDPLEIFEENPHEICLQEHPQHGTMCPPSMTGGENYSPFGKFTEWVPQFNYDGNLSDGMGVEHWWERSARVVCVDEFGAEGDGETDDTKAFKKAWKRACSSDPAVFLVPNGKKYLLKPVTFSGPCKSALTLQVSGMIVAPGDPKVWEGFNRRQWIRFKGVNDLTVEGGGTIYGSGDQWWAQSCKINKTNPCRPAPTAVIFESNNNLRVKNIIVQNSQQMHVKFRKCAGVHVDHLKVIAPGQSPNTDGIHISASKHVMIKNSIIGTGKFNMVTGFSVPSCAQASTFITLIAKCPNTLAIQPQVKQDIVLVSGSGGHSCRSSIRVLEPENILMATQNLNIMTHPSLPLIYF